MDLIQVAWLLTGAAVGGFVNGMAGFGTALFALAFFLNATSPVQAVAIILVLALVGGAQGLWAIRDTAFTQPGRLGVFLIPALIGIPVGVYILTIVNQETLKILIALSLIVYGSYYSFRRRLPVLSKPSPMLDALVGFTSGILGGAASLSGMVITIWCSLKPWTKAEIRSVIQVFNFIVLGITMIVFIVRGVYEQQVLLMILISLPVTLLFVRIGLAVYGKLSTEVYRRLLIGLTYVSGLLIILSLLVMYLD